MNAWEALGAGTLHLVFDDVIEHDTSTPDACVCGPTPELVETGDGDRWLIRHHSLAEDEGENG